MAKTKLLSDLQLRQWVKAGAPLAKSDGEGLTFTVSTAGHSTWVLRYRQGKRRFELTLGPYPDLSLADARETASLRRAEILKGVNPVVERQRTKAQIAKDWTVRMLIKDYQEKRLPALALNTQRIYSRHLARVERKLGVLNLRDVESGDIVNLIEDSELTWGESNLLLITAKVLFKHGCGKRMINANPCAGIILSALLGPRPPIRKRLMLTKKEVEFLLSACMHRRNKLGLRILLGTGVRASELFTAKWEDVHLDEDYWRIPDSKTDVAMDIPLTPWVKECFVGLKQLATDSAYVLPAHFHSRAEAHGGDFHLGKDTLRESIDYWIKYHKPDVRRFTPHDLRSTMKSHMRALGVPRDISEMCLNHKLTGVEGIYDRHNYFEERRHALGLWADFLKQCE